MIYSKYFIVMKSEKRQSPTPRHGSLKLPGAPRASWTASEINVDAPKTWMSLSQERHRFVLQLNRSTPPVPNPHAATLTLYSCLIQPKCTPNFPQNSNRITHSFDYESIFDRKRSFGYFNGEDDESINCDVHIGRKIKSESSLFYEQRRSIILSLDP